MPRFSRTGRPHLPSVFSSAKVLHVARADLQDVGILGHQLDIAVAHHFGDDAEAGGAPGFIQQLEAFQLQALEIVGRSARLERAAAQKLGAVLAPPASADLQDLLLAFHRAGAGHHDELIAADRHAVAP